MWPRGGALCTCLLCEEMEVGLPRCGSTDPAMHLGYDSAHFHLCVCLCGGASRGTHRLMSLWVWQSATGQQWI